MLAAIVNVNHLVEVSGYPLLFVLVMGESSGRADPGETALITAAVLASQGKLEIELVIALAAAAAIVGDNIGYQIGRKGGRWLLSARAASSASAARCSPSASRSSNARPQGRVLRALRARPARVGVVARRRHAHALALVLPVERARRHLLGDRDRPGRLLTRPLRRQRDRSVRPLRAGAPCSSQSARTWSCTAAIAAGHVTAGPPRRRPAAATNGSRPASRRRRRFRSSRTRSSRLRTRTLRLSSPYRSPRSPEPCRRR